MHKAMDEEMDHMLSIADDGVASSVNPFPPSVQGEQPQECEQS